jgi:phosphomevalonate kinase
MTGAYSVLEGAPAIVAAVDRYVTADTELIGDRLTDEVRAAGIATPIWFDATALRQDERKLGLGSSAAILVACLAAKSLVQCGSLQPQQLAQQLFMPALLAHRAAQAGGSGLDVAAACFGGVLEYRVGISKPDFLSLAAPTGLHLEVWASRSAASTRDMLDHVRQFRCRAPEAHRHDLKAQADAATATVEAWRKHDVQAVIRGCVAQRHALAQLGADAGIPIVTPEVAALADLAERASAAVLPAGAGGGDIALYLGERPSDFLTDALQRFGHTRLSMRLGALGVHAV